MNSAFNWSYHFLYLPYLEHLLGTSFCDYARPIHIIKFMALQQKLVFGIKNLNLKIFNIYLKLLVKLRCFSLMLPSQF